MNYEYIPHIATAVFVLIMSSLVIYLIRVAFKEKEDDLNFEKQLKFTIDPQGLVKEEESWLTRQTKALPNKMIEAGLVEENVDIDALQRKMLLMAALLWTGTAFFTRNLFAGFVPIIMAYIAAFGYAMYKISKTKNLMNEQIPAFVATFKANIQANQHAQNAMIRAIDGTASPLYDELAYSKAIMEAGDFRPGIIALRKSTENETLRQMASCIELASASGSNIENQIDIIESIIQDKQKIERKKALGVNENKPLFIVAALFVPIAFAGSYFMSDIHRDFWFKSLLSWGVIVFVLCTMALSCFLTWKVIQKIEIN